MTPGAMYFGPTDAVLRISLDDVEPEVWRRVVVPSDIVLPELADVLLAAMGWEGYHLHQFVIADVVSFAMPDEDNEWLIDERQVTLQQISRNGSTFSFEYDFGDGWRHTVSVESVGEPDPARKPPMLIDGANACPPEDCGGPWGYANLREALDDPGHEEHEAMRDWAGDDFDQARFELSSAAKRVRAVMVRPVSRQLRRSPR
jgi:hypothetical protein